MFLKSTEHIPVFFWDEQGRVSKGWTMGDPVSKDWIELDRVRGIREGYSNKEKVPMERVMPALPGIHWEGCPTPYLQNILDHLLDRDPLQLLESCLVDALECDDACTASFPRDPAFWHRWEWMQTMALRHPARKNKAGHFSLVEREFAAFAVEELDRRHRHKQLSVKGQNRASQPCCFRFTRWGEYAAQLSHLAELETADRLKPLRIKSLAEMVSRLVEQAEYHLRQRMIGERIAVSSFRFHEDDFVSAYPGEVERSVLVHWLTERSVKLGEWQGRSVAQLHREQPVRQRPLIRLGDGWYAWPLVGGAGRHAWDWLFPVDGKQDTVKVERGKEVVRDRVISLFQQTFPKASVHEGVRWRHGSGQEGVLDVIVSLPPFLFALRTEKTDDLQSTGLDGVRNGIGELVRLCQAWEEHPSPVVLEMDRGMVPSAERLVAMMVTLEPIGDAVYREGLDGCPPIYSLSELQNLFSLLDGSVRKADYLWKRSRSSMVVDEWKRLTAYWLTGSPDRWQGGVGKRKGKGLEPFLPYLERAWEGKRVAAMEERFTHWWSAMLRKLEKSDASEALWIGTQLVNVDLGTQNRFERQIKRLKQEIRKGIHHPEPIVWSKSYRLVGAVVNPEEERERPIHLRHKALRKHLMRTGDPWVIILFYQDDYQYPYSHIQLLGP